MHSDSDDTETEFLLALNGPTAVDRRRCLAWWVSFSKISVRSREKFLFGDALIDATKNLSTCSRPFKNFSRWHYSAQNCFRLFLWFIALFVFHSTLWLISVLEQLHHNSSRWIKDLFTVLSRSEWKRSSINLRCAPTRGLGQADDISGRLKLHPSVNSLLPFVILSCNLKTYFSTRWKFCSVSFQPSKCAVGKQWPWKY